MNNKVLVTGGTGFVGMRIISRLLEQGYEVQTTIRDLSKADKVIKTMQDNGISTERLMFVEADLSQDEHWDEAMKDCKYVLSVASPVFFGKTDDAEVMAKPAIERHTTYFKSCRTCWREACGDDCKLWCSWF